jgi:hypothetical protein
MTKNKQSGVPDYLYIVNYCRGNVDEGFRRVNLFVTMEEETAKKYVQKFNSILKKCKKYWDDWENEMISIHADSYMFCTHTNMDRYYLITDIDEAFYEKIEKR